MDENTAHRLKGRFLKAGHLIGLFLAMTIICLPGSGSFFPRSARQSRSWPNRQCGSP